MESHIRGYNIKILTSFPGLFVKIAWFMSLSFIDLDMKHSHLSPAVPLWCDKRFTHPYSPKATITLQQNPQIWAHSELKESANSCSHPCSFIVCILLLFFIMKLLYICWMNRVVWKHLQRAKEQEQKWNHDSWSRGDVWMREIVSNRPHDELQRKLRFWREVKQMSSFFPMLHITESRVNSLFDNGNL